MKTGLVRTCDVCDIVIEPEDQQWGDREFANDDRVRVVVGFSQRFRKSYCYADMCPGCLRAINIAISGAMRKRRGDSC